MNIFPQCKMQLISVSFDNCKKNQYIQEPQHMIKQAGESNSNQYGFYAVPKALEPKKKYRESFEDYDEDEDSMQNDLEFETIDQSVEDQKQLQKDFYVDEAPYPEFKPKEKGLDYGVQIEKHDLFDFDLEAQPLIQILVGRSVVSAINELQEEKEINDKKAALSAYQKKRNAQLMVTQRLETKSKRKHEEAQRRQLQKQIYIKNQRQAAKKLISRKNAKHALLGLKKQVLNDLQDEGYLKKNTYLDLRVQFEGWLYEQISNLRNQDREVMEVIENMSKGRQRDIEGEHQKAIRKEKERRQQILNDRQRTRIKNEERKRKKKIRKQRLQLNNERQPRSDAAFDQVNKYQHVNKILKSQEISNGLTRKKNSNETAHIAGGLLNYILIFLNSQEKQFSPEEVQEIIMKILAEIQGKVQVPLSEDHFSQFSSLREFMDDNQIQFMKNKEQKIKELLEKISLDLSLIQSLAIHLNSNLHLNILRVFLNIQFTTFPEPKKEGEQMIDSYNPTDQDKKNGELKQKIQFSSNSESTLQQFSSVGQVVRVHFDRVRPEDEDEKSEEIREKTKEQLLDEWIDIFDGEGWPPKDQPKLEESNRQNQGAASYILNGFDNIAVIDERNLHYLKIQLEKLLELDAGDSLKRYEDGLQQIRVKIGEVPVYDVELEWE